MTQIQDKERGGDHGCCQYDGKEDFPHKNKKEIVDINFLLPI
jgi:hypothetical protein